MSKRPIYEPETAQTPMYRTPDWAFWQSATVATLNECVALSCDFEPRGFLPSWWPTMVELGMMFPDPAMSGRTGEQLRDTETEALFALRFQAVAASVSSEGPLHPDQTVTHSNVVGSVRLRLKEFVDWAVSAGWSLPDEMHATKRRNATSGLTSFQMECRRLAEEVVESERGQTWRSGPSPKEQIAKDVARKLEKLGRKSTHGNPYAWETVKKHGLKGWNPPKGTKRSR